MPSKAISELVYLVVCRGIVGKICHHALWSPHPHNHSAAISESRFLCKKKMGALFYFPFVCISVYANVYFMTILRECLRGLPSTVPRPVFDSAVLGTLSVSVWIANQKKISTIHEVIWPGTFDSSRLLSFFQITW